MKVIENGTRTFLLREEVFRTDWHFGRNPIAENWEKISEEWLANKEYYQEKVHGSPYHIAEHGPNYQRGEWGNLGLAFNSKILYYGAEELFPTLYECLEQIPLLSNCCFSVIGPKSYLVPHFGDSLPIQRCHTVIEVPDNATSKLFVQTDVEEIHEIEYNLGTSFFFDNTLLHWAGNPSPDQQRVNIMFDVWVDEKSRIDYGDDYYEKQRRSDSQTNKRKRLVRK